MTTTTSPSALDKVAALRWQRIAPTTSPWLHEEVARRMLERLAWIKLLPASWAHWGAVRGGMQAHAQLLATLKKSPCFLVESIEKHQVFAIKNITKPWWHRFVRKQPQQSVAAPPAGSVDMVWANMALHEAADPQSMLQQWHQALNTNGFLMFSCLGPDTALEIRQLYAQLGWPPAGHALTDMHDWGDMLVHTGFTQPVMDMEKITLSYSTPQALLKELAELGRNFHPQRFTGLRGKTWRAELEQQLKKNLATEPDGRLSLTFEVIYGHAIKPAPKITVQTVSTVSVQDMRSLLKASRAERPLQNPPTNSYSNSQ